MKFTPLRVTFIYLGIAVIWILASDYIAEAIATDINAFSTIQTYKGVFYVCLTAIMLFVMMKSYENYIAKKESEFETIIHDTSAGMAVLRDKIIESSNVSFQKIFNSEIRDHETKITDFLHRDDKNRFLKLLEDVDTPETWESAEFRFQLEEGEQIWLMATARNIELNGDQRKLLTVEDITERKQFQIYTELLLELIISIEPAKDLKQALDKVLKNICERIDWDFAEAWVPDKTNKDLIKRLTCWARDIPEIKKFDKKCKAYSFYQGEGIPGMAAKDKEALWIKDVTKHQSYERRDLAQDSGLKTAFAVPLVVDHEIFAVLMLYSVLEMEEDPSLVRLLSAAANDISVKLKQKRDQQKRAEAEQNLQLALESAGMATWQVDIKTGQVKSSDTFAEMLGFKNRPVNDVESLSKNILKKDRKKVDEEFEKSLRGVVPFNVEFRVQNEDGTVSWLWARGKPVVENGVLAYLRGVTTVINQRKRLEQKLNREKEFLDQLFKNLPVMITTYKPGPDVLEVNREFEKLTGYSTGDLKNPDVMKTVYPDEKERQKTAEFMSKPGSGWMDFNLKTKWGTVVKSTWTNVQLSDDTLIGIGIDISERIEKEEKLQENEHILAESQKVANLGSYYLDLETKEARTSQVLDKIFGAPEDDPMTLEKWAQMVHPAHKNVLKEFSRAMELQSPFSAEYKIKRQDNGEDRWVYEKAEVMLDNNGEAKAMIGIIQDITGQKMYEQELNEMVHVFQYANVGIVTGSPNDENMHRMNKTFAEMHGYTVNELSGKPIETVFAADYKPHIKEYIRKANEQGHLIAESRHKRKDGEEFPVLLSVQSVKDPDGKIDRRIVSVQDITELKHMRDKLAMEQARFETAAGVVSDVIWDFDAATGELWWSDGIETVFGYDSYEILNDHDFWKTHIHEADRKRVLQSMEEAEVSGESEWNESYRFLDSEGNYRFVEDSASIIRNADGEIVRIIGAMVDKTIEEEAKKVVKQAMDQYRLLFEQSPIPMWIYDLESYRFLEVNDAAVKKYGYSKDEFSGMSLFDIRPEEDFPVFKKNLLKTKNSALSFEESRHLTKGGKEMIVEISASDIMYKDKKQRLIVANDITRQRRAEETRLRALVKGEEKERRRIAKELHDGLGQYLSAVNMNFESLAEEVQAFKRDEKEQFLHGLDLLKQAMQETRTISQNLMPKAIEDYGLALAVESLVDDLGKNTKLELYYYQNIEDLSIRYNVQINLYRVIQEALNNAIRHSRCQKIHIQLVESENDIILSIEDNGVGFDPDDKKVSGLGLHSMETRASALSGKLDISSKIDKGTTITMVVPL